MKYRLGIMFLIVLTGMISIAAFNPIIGPLARNLGLSDFQSGCLVSVWTLLAARRIFLGKTNVHEPKMAACFDHVRLYGNAHHFCTTC